MIATTLARLFRFLPESEDDAHGIYALVARERPLASLDRRSARSSVASPSCTS